MCPVVQHENCEKCLRVCGVGSMGVGICLFEYVFVNMCVCVSVYLSARALAGAYVADRVC